MAADTLREKLQALVGELHQQASIYRRGQELRDERQALVYTQVARKIAAILAESEEPKHPAQTNQGRTHYVGDDCPGGHAEVGEMLPVAKR